MLSPFTQSVFWRLAYRFSILWRRRHCKYLRTRFGLHPCLFIFHLISEQGIRYINRCLVPPISPWPKDANKLRLSIQAFRLLCSHYHANLQHSSPQAFPSRKANKDFDFWFFVPVRVQVQCNDTKRSHTFSSKGKSQINPLNYLHLPQPSVDVRGSKIAVYYLFNRETKHSSTLVFNFQDRRWKKVVKEPILRIRDTYRFCDDHDFGRDPFHI